MIKGHRARYYTKLALALVVMFVAIRVLAATGLGRYALPLSFLPALALFWFLWPEVWYSSPLPPAQVRMIKALQFVLFFLGLVGVWGIDVAAKST